VNPISPSSASQFEQQAAGLVPEVEQIREGMWSIPLPYRKAIPFTLCYAIQDREGGLHLIDPGSEEEGNRDRFLALLTGVGFTTADIASITLSHLHPDHAGLTNWLAGLTGLPVGMHPIDAHDLQSGAAEARYALDVTEISERWGVPRDERVRLEIPPELTPYRPVIPRVALLEDRDVIPIPGRTVRAILTPGHTRGHLCFDIEGEHLLLSGDHVLPATYTPIGRGGRVGRNSIADYLDSLETISFADDFESAPGHGFRFFGLADRRAKIRDHVLRRAREVETGLAELGDVATIWELAQRLTWRGGLLGLSATSLQSALSQTESHVDFVRDFSVEAYSRS
jgi:glyoxylase-like metal-dependent hydrolase (beta-lactamase superfamily II)